MSSIEERIQSMNSSTNSAQVSQALMTYLLTGDTYGTA